jgi:hypothetical protein
MSISSGVRICKACQYSGTGKFCSNCGQPYEIKRITVSGIVHEVFHLFTHVDKGLLYTLKKLITAPGHMQRDYIKGARARHQKPFSLYFICATVTALALFWINIALMNYFDAGDAKEAMFFNKYMVWLLIGAAPFSILITYAFFFNSSYNLAEIGVMQLYTVSVFLLIVVVANLLKFIWPSFESRIIEIPMVMIYNTITFVNFFNDSKKWKVILKSLGCAAIFFAGIATVQDALIEKLFG